MSRSDHEDSSIARLMTAPLTVQSRTMAQWGLPPAGLLIMMSPCLGQCIFCAQPAVTHPPPTDWTQWARIRELLAGNAQAGLKHLCIGGTEPTTHPDFDRALQLAGQVGFDSIELMTSGLSLSNPGEAQRWRAAGIQTIAVPIYGASADVHNQVVGVDAYARLMTGLNAAHAAGIQVRPHTLALRETLPGLSALAAMVTQRWHSPLCLAPARPKDAVWNYTAQAPGLASVAQAIAEVPPDQLTLTGWPSCLAPERPRGAAQVIDLYFRGQTRDFHTACEPCATQQTCPGLVSALLTRDGADGLRPM